VRPGLLFAAPPGEGHRLSDRLAGDLGLDVVVDAMAAGDPVLAGAAREVLLAAPPGPDHVAHRQEVLTDCLSEPGLARELYELAGRAVDAERRAARAIFFDTPETLLNQSIVTLTAYLQLLRDLRTVAGRYRARASSGGFRRFFALIDEQFDDAYLKDAAEHLHHLRFRGNLLVSAGLGAGNRSEAYVVRRPPPAARGLFRRGARGDRPTATYRIPHGDEAAHRAVSALRDQSLAGLAAVAVRAARDVLSFFTALRTEVAFYLGCLNLRQALAERGAVVSLPQAAPGALRARGLYDPGLQLRLDRPVTGNDFDADGRSLIMVTGAGRGGKSTFLRSVGLAQLMASAGMFVAAAAFTTAPRTGVFTHFTRDEDDTLTSGKFDEELRRMSRVAAAVSPGGLLLCNESFQSTNEREGSAVARHIVDAMTGAGVTVVFVTHLHELALGCHRDRDRFPALFLRAGADATGRPSFRLREAPPEATSHGTDLWNRLRRG